MAGANGVRSVIGWTTSLLIAGAAVTVLPAGGLAPAAAGQTTNDPAVESLLGAGHAAVARGDHGSADELFRRAWSDPALRDRAAEALDRLHRRRDFKLPVDNDAVNAAHRAAGAAFRRVETAHFVILSDCPDAWTRDRAQLLERTRLQFFRASERLGARLVPHRQKLLCILFDNPHDYRAFGRAQDGLDAGWVAGYYATAPNRIVFYNDARSPAYEGANRKLAEYESQAEEARRRSETTRDQDPGFAARLLSSADDMTQQVRAERDRLSREAAAHSTAKTIHEAVHLLSFNTGLQRRDRDYPFWLCEGLASCFETAEPSKAFGPDRGAPAGRLARYRELAGRGGAPTVAEVLVVGQAPIWDAETAEAMYATSAALFSYLYRRDQAALGAYIRSFDAEGPGRIGPARQRALFALHFGDPDILDLRIRADLR